jgi:hypothetical protein
MNVGGGLFRGWMLMTVIWLIGAGTLAYFIIGDEIWRWKWQYVHIMREDVPDPNEVDWKGPYYENMRSPSAEKLAVTFSELEYQYVQPWNEYVKEGKMVLKEMPDHSSLYLDTHLTKDDQEYLVRAFWDQRWSRYASFAKIWIPILVVPPIVLFILGWALLWVCRGFQI